MWCCWNSPNHNPVTTHASAVRNSLAAISLNDPGQVGPLLSIYGMYEPDYEPRTPGKSGYFESFTGAR
jgi:hypothetical protein